MVSITKQNYNLIIVILGILLCSKCNNSTNSNQTNVNNPMLILGGRIMMTDNISSAACYWKDNSLFYLTDTVNQSMVSSIVHSNGTTYILGNTFESNDSIIKNWLWKDGVMSYITNGPEYVNCAFMGILGDDIYIIGIDFVDLTKFKPLVWKNGNIIPFIEDSIGATVSGMDIDGADIYISGNLIDSNLTYTPCYWKNGKRYILNTPSNGLILTSGIAIHENDVYVIGYVLSGPNEKNAVIWKNNTVSWLTQNSDMLKIPTSIFISDNNDIHIVGIAQNAKSRAYENNNISFALYWKNNVETQLTKEPIYSAALAVSILNNDVYIGGYEQDGLDSNMHACYWKNGENILLPTIDRHTSITSMIISNTSTRDNNIINNSYQLSQKLIQKIKLNLVHN